MLNFETLRDLGLNGNERIHVGFDKYTATNGAREAE
jgi:hypothetical protein